MNNFIKAKLDILLISFQIALTESITKYQRSVFGTLWITLNMLITVSALGIVFSSVFGMPIKDYVPFVFTGFLTWNFIQSTIVDSTTVYLSGSKKFYNFHNIFLPSKLAFKNIIIFFHNVTIYFLILIFIDKSIFNLETFFLIFPALILYVITAILLTLLLAPLCTKFLDLGFMISNAVYVLFLITPVFWNPDILSGKKFLLVSINPAYHYINLIRQPLLGHFPSLMNYIFVISLIFILFILYKLFYKNLNKNIALYL